MSIRVIFKDFILKIVSRIRITYLKKLQKRHSEFVSESHPVVLLDDENPKPVQVDVKNQ